MKDSIHWKFRPILGGCFTNPPKGTPPLKGYTRCKHVSGGYETTGGVVLLFSPWAYPLHVPRLQFLIQLQRTFAPSKVEVEVFLPEIFEHHQIIFHKKLRVFLLFTYFVVPFWGKGIIFVFLWDTGFCPECVNSFWGDAKNDTLPSSKCLRMKRFSEPQHHISPTTRNPEILWKTRLPIQDHHG